MTAGGVAAPRTVAVQLQRAEVDCYLVWGAVFVQPDVCLTWTNNAPLVYITVN